jgi:hypothetical protein
VVEAKLTALAQVARMNRPVSDTRDIVDAAAAVGEVLKAGQLLKGKSAHDLIVEALSRERQLAEASSKTNSGEKPGGPGTEHPACWISGNTGKPEYIFDVALRNQSIEIHDNVLPDRAADQRALPLALISYDEPLSPMRFMAITLPLFEWSEEHDCRFS